jgi:hypothetical protein
MHAPEMKSALSVAYYRYSELVRAHHELSRQELQRRALGLVDLEVLDGLHAMAQRPGKPETCAGTARLQALLGDPDLFGSEALRAEFEQTYLRLRKAEFPASEILLEHRHAIHGLAHSFSLSLVDLKTVQAIDIQAEGDPQLAEFRREMVEALAGASKPDVLRHAAFFEVYSEARVYLALRGKMSIRKIRERGDRGEKTPDFECRLGARLFYVEVKSFDIVDGPHRHDELMTSSVDTMIELEEQAERGAPVGFAAHVIDPYRRYASSAGEPNSAMTVIRVLRAKIRGSFRPGQFELGPTFGLAVLDRLVVPGGASALAPYFLHPLVGEPGPGICVSGVLWHAAFGKVGAPVLRLPQAAGLAALEGTLSEDGAFVDPADPFPGVGLLTFKRTSQANRLYGLFDRKHAPVGAWTADDTEAVLAALCDAYNDRESANGHILSVYAPD